MPPGPRIYVIPATEADVAAVIRRGPSSWTHIGRWMLDGPDYEPGAWFRGTIPPQKCDLSPDGRWFLASAVTYPGRWEGGPVYEAISRLPWLEALVAWSAGTTYTRGAHFVDDTGRNELGEPDVGDAAPVLATLGVALTRPVQFAVERRRGWLESADTPPRVAGGPWDEGRLVEMRKPRPRTSAEPEAAASTSEQATLCVTGHGAGFRVGPMTVDRPTYWLELGNDLVPLAELQWADWTRDGRMLAATTDGHLQIRTVSSTGSFTIDFDADLVQLRPQPEPAPRWAREL